MHHYSAPGKLFISGEWAILEVGNLGLVAAVNNRVHVYLKESDHISLTAEEFGVREVKAEHSHRKLVLHTDDDKKKNLALLAEAISTALNFLADHKIHAKPFSIKTSSKDTQFMVGGQLKKVGFGSSAAVVVATIAGLLDFHGYKATKEEVYKLSAIAHFYAQGKVGSAFDVAASSFGGLFVYSRFDPVWLTQKIESGAPLASLVAEKWPHLIIEEVPVPQDFKLLVGWTGESFSTSNAIKQMNEFKAAHQTEYEKFFNEIGTVAKNAIHSFKAQKYDDFYLYLIENESILKRLGETSGVNIETPELAKLSDIAIDCGAAGKLSGSGGGDCGIAVCFDSQVAENITKKWQESGLQPLDVSIDTEGVRKEAS